MGEFAKHTLYRVTWNSFKITLLWLIRQWTPRPIVSFVTYVAVVYKFVMCVPKFANDFSLTTLTLKFTDLSLFLNIKSLTLSMTMNIYVLPHWARALKKNEKEQNKTKSRNSLLWRSVRVYSQLIKLIGKTTTIITRPILTQLNKNMIILFVTCHYKLLNIIALLFKHYFMICQN